MEPMTTNVSSVLQDGEIDSFDDERALRRHAFLKRSGLEQKSLIPLPTDASKRRYFRGSPYLLMDAPPPYENVAYFQRVASFLREAGLTVPQIYDADLTHGFLLIEDFGNTLYRKALQEGIAESLLYSETVRALLHLHHHTIENKLKFPAYSLELFLKETDIFLEWYGIPLTTQAKEDFRNLWTEHYQNQPLLPQSFVLRDVMVDNLLWLPSRQGFKRCGFIDFQGGTQEGVWGPITYDLVSLLEDARRDVAPQFAQDILEIYFQGSPNLSREDFWASYALWGAQRCTKILGIFSRLAKRDEKPQYLTHIPRVWKILKRDLRHPNLKAIRNWFDLCVKTQ